MMRAVLAAVLAVTIFAVGLALAMGADMARREGPSVTPTFIPAPRVVLLKCVEEMDGFHCEEIAEACR